MLIVVLVWLTIYRVTRLVVDDAWPPSVALRGRVFDRFGQDSTIGYLFSCSWCMSLWLGAVIVVGADLTVRHGITAPVLVWASASAVAGYLSTLEPG